MSKRRKNKNSYSRKPKPNNGGGQSLDISTMDFTAIMKQAIINGDPSFFIPSFRQDKAVEEAVLDPYEFNVWVYAAVRAITTNLIPLPKALDIKSTEEKELIFKNPALTLLDKPNQLMDGPTFWENVILNLMLPTKTTKGGQCFILSQSLNGEPVNLRKGEIPAELFPFSDEFIKPIISKDDNMTLLGWAFKPRDDMDPIIYKPFEVIRINLVDPKHPLRGQCPLWATRSGIRQDAKAQRLNERFFDNNASLGGTLESEAEIAGPVGQELRESFEERHAGQDNAGKIALLHSGVKYVQSKQNHKDMEFIEQRKWTREEVLAAYGVPKFNVGVYEDINFATANAADKAFWKNTLIPLDTRILRAFTVDWVQFLPPTTHQLVSDYSTVIALAPDFTEKLTQAKTLYEMGIPVSVINKRLELNLSIDEFSWLQTALVSSKLAPAEDIMDGTAGEVTEEDDDEKLEPTSADPNALSPEDEKSMDPVIRFMKTLNEVNKEDDAIEALKKSYIEDVIIPDEKNIQKLLNKFFKEQRNLVLDIVDAWAKGKKTKAEDEEVPDPLKLSGIVAAENKRLRKLFTPEYFEMLLKESEVVEVELGGLVDWEPNSPSMKKIVKNRLKQLGSVNKTTTKSARRAIQRAIEQSFRQELNAKETAKLIKKEVNKVFTGKIDSGTIARTEVNAIHSETRMEIYRETGIKKIKWITVRDAKVRRKPDAKFPHNVLHQKVSKIKTGFNNGETIKYPHDPHASAGNVINCRCFVISQA